MSIWRIPLNIENGISTFGEGKVAHVDFGSWKLKDFCFIDDEEILLAVCNGCKPLG